MTVPGVDVSGLCNDEYSFLFATWQLPVPETHKHVEYVLLNGPQHVVC